MWIERGFSFYVGDVGTEMPFMFWSISDKDRATFYNNDEKIMEALGEEAGQLFLKGFIVFQFSGNPSGV